MYHCCQSRKGVAVIYVHNFGLIISPHYTILLSVLSVLLQVFCFEIVSEIISLLTNVTPNLLFPHLLLQNIFPRIHSLYNLQIILVLVISSF